MKIAGIIAEYDPFHKGHAYQLARVRQMGAEKIIVCMSCDVVQRGTFAVLPPAVRAEAALKNGADIVAALPNPWACATAETFAAAGVHILSALGCDTLAFGAETPNAENMMDLAALLDSPAFSKSLRAELAAGADFASARARAVQKISPKLSELLNEPNNLLGVEYCKAILRQKSPLTPLPIERKGAGHGEQAKPGQTFASASAVRAMWQCGQSEQAEIYLAQNTHALYGAAWHTGLWADPARVDVAVLSRLRGMNADDFARIRGVNEGLENRMASCVQTALTLPQLYDQLKTKRYAHSRLRRLALDSALGYDSALPALPPFALILGAKKSALPLLKKAALPAGLSLSDLFKANAECAAAANAHAKAADLAALCRHTPCAMGLAFTQKPVLLP